MSVPPILICSRGRPEGKTFGLLRAAGLPYFAIVEPQEEKEYQRQGHLTWSLVQNDMGLAYARQSALAFARSLGHEYFWMLDDDISGFYRAESGRNLPEAADVVLGTAAEALIGLGVGQGALEYQQFAWSAEPGKIRRNSYCDVAVLIRTSVAANFRDLGSKVDRDFTLQVLAAGHDTARTGWLSFAAPTNGSNAGGLREVYLEEGREEADSRRLEALWPGIAEFRPKPNGRPDAKIHWRRLRPSQERIVLT